MKDILIVANNLEIGGAERALISLLNTMDTNEFNVDLFLLRHDGEFMNMIPKKVNVLPEKKEFTALGIPIIEALKKGLFVQVFGRLIGKTKSAIYKRKNNISGPTSIDIEYSYKYTKSYMPMISDKKYDLAIGFSTPYYFVDEKTIATKKLGWLHTDYSHLSGDTESELKLWSIYDNIISISDKVTESFIKKYPSLEPKILLIENIISPDIVKMESEKENVSKEMISEGDEIKILSIGRFAEAKNFKSVPKICKYMCDMGVKVRWYLIGYGKEESSIREEIQRYNMQNNVIILGKKQNPYPYIKACDIYVQPSLFEGKSVAVIEAQILNKPVVITNFTTAKSQLKDGIDGIIVPVDSYGCANGIVTLIKDKELQQRLIDNTKKSTYSNESEVEKIYALMGV